VNNYYTQETDIYTRFVETKRVMMEVFAQNEKLSGNLQPRRRSQRTRSISV